MDHLVAIEVGRGLAIAGAGLAIGLGCAGSGKGIAIASQAAAGVLSEKPSLFGQLLVMIALPGTQGFYGFITGIMIFRKTGLLAGEWAVAPNTGVALLVMGLGVGIALYVSAVWQGEASAAGISLVARRPEEAGRALLFPAMVETYAVVALLAAILVIFWLTAPGAVGFLEQVAQ
ncbi:MAG TPA: V-type ATP synthase subunit K [Candidatus Hydrogenedentes bacterium]|nr:V-type ATP synthase subunit K [Candidatus Hydrogenedentota bacterium]HPG70006.1 V-type ATP synthase subunit K [Candidatus Hydrogenedentota bacterium]